jgi:hypothetical protein
MVRGWVSLSLSFFFWYSLHAYHFVTDKEEE